MNALQKKLKYIQTFFDKNFQCVGKDDNHKNHVETKEEDLHYVPEAKEGQLLSIKIQKTENNKSKYTSRKKVKLKFLNEM